jgi:hypothetical protein
MDPILQVAFDGLPGLQFNQGEDRTILITLVNQTTGIPINLTGSVVGLNLPRQGGGNIKRTSGVVAVPYLGVNINPTNTITLPDHGFVTGDPIQVAAQGGGTLPGGLATLTNYLVVVIDNNTFSLIDTSGNPIVLTTQGTVGFNITNSNDLALVSGDLGQATLNLRALVSADANAALAQNFQFQYTLSSKTRIVVIAAQLDVIAQPDP